MYSATQTARATKDVVIESHSSDEELASLAKALAHPARLQIIRLLLEKKTCIGGDIVDEIGLAQSTVSEHLRILKSSGIITGEITRPRVCYSLNPERLKPLMGFLNLAAVDEPESSDTSSCWVSPTAKTHES